MHVTWWMPSSFMVVACRRMRAVVIEQGKVGSSERPDPVPGTGEVLVRVQAAGVNNADLLQAAGRYPPPPGVPEDMPGLECAGEVAEAVPCDGRPCDGASLPGAGQAELVAVDERHVLPVPGQVDWPQAGGFMEAFATAHDAVFTQAELQPGERLLVNGAAGGVGTAAVQLRRRAREVRRAPHARGRAREPRRGARRASRRRGRDGASTT